MADPPLRAWLEAHLTSLAIAPSFAVELGDGDRLAGVLRAGVGRLLLCRAYASRSGPACALSSFSRWTVACSNDGAAAAGRVPDTAAAMRVDAPGADVSVQVANGVWVALIELPRKSRSQRVSAQPVDNGGRPVGPLMFATTVSMQD
jgi:hypothetical protein